jgi:hypothetical protein
MSASSFKPSAHPIRPQRSKFPTRSTLPINPIPLLHRLSPALPVPRPTARQLLSLRTALTRSTIPHSHRHQILLRSLSVRLLPHTRYPSRFLLAPASTPTLPGHGPFPITPHINFKNIPLLPSYYNLHLSRFLYSPSIWFLWSLDLVVTVLKTTTGFSISCTRSTVSLSLLCLISPAPNGPTRRGDRFNYRTRSM